MHETRDQRIERLRQLVITHDSYAVVARMEGLSRERVRKIVGNGLTSLSRGPQPGVCIDCNRKYRAVIRPGHDGRCKRCRYFFDKHAQPWSLKAVQQVRRRTHCKRGHELTPENTYISRYRQTGAITRACRTCKLKAMNQRNQTPEGKAAIRKRNRQQYAKIMADPEKRKKYLAHQAKHRREQYRKQRAKQLSTRKGI